MFFPFLASSGHNKFMAWYIQKIYYNIVYLKFEII